MNSLEADGRLALDALVHAIRREPNTPALESY